MSSPLLTLAPELRNRIYDFVYLPSDEICKESLFPPHTFALSYTCKLMYHETHTLAIKGLLSRTNLFIDKTHGPGRYNRSTADLAQLKQLKSIPQEYRKLIKVLHVHVEIARTEVVALHDWWPFKNAGLKPKLNQIEEIVWVINGPNDEKAGPRLVFSQLMILLEVWRSCYLPSLKKITVVSPQMTGPFPYEEIYRRFTNRLFWKKHYPYAWKPFKWAHVDGELRISHEIADLWYDPCRGGWVSRSMLHLGSKDVYPDESQCPLKVLQDIRIVVGRTVDEAEERNWSTMEED